ncbi:glycosyltransferase family 4 protein [Halomicrococcus sp. NG-SE-24]|uniref:glycosyltransferase family 4 protein n=1 Tax=Halomicrococcus sp. NG-SE-24 TaxID=3436928 RepID=UPI003D9933C8
MAKIAVVHPDFAVKGGAESVSLNVLEALQDDHDVTLFTTATPDFEELNQYYNTEIKQLTVSVPTTNRLLNTVTEDKIGLFKYAVLNRCVQDAVESFDLVIGTYNEFGTANQFLLYIHHPLYAEPEYALDARTQSTARSLYKQLCQRVASVTPKQLQSGRILTNSDWIGELVADEYDVQPTTVYPPVNAEAFATPPLSDQEPGFVSIGRFAPDKKILRNIEIVVRLRELGHAVHLHLIGPDHMSEYQQKVEEVASKYDYIHIENELSHDELTQMVSSHRYGLHGKPNEHFGMVVAEMVAGNTLPFIPDSGGQPEIVNRRSELLYTSVSDAVEKIDAVLSDPELEQKLRDSLPPIGDRFGRTRFREEVQEIVSQEVTK